MMKTLEAKLVKAGMTASLLCAIECSITPFAILLFPFVTGSHREISFGIFSEISPYLDWILLGVVGCLALGSQILTFPRHRRLIPLILSGIGFTIMMYGRFWWTGGQLGESLVIVCGAGILIGAGWMNRRLQRYLCECHRHP
jgi:hypothetical protein